MVAVGQLLFVLLHGVLVRHVDLLNRQVLRAYEKVVQHHHLLGAPRAFLLFLPVVLVALGEQLQGLVELGFAAGLALGVERVLFDPELNLLVVFVEGLDLGL